MPYVQSDDREAVEHELNRLRWRILRSHPGQINYVISRIVNECVIGDNPNYAKINEAIGILECAKLELYRRVAAPYEDAKKEENGDVY